MSMTIQQKTARSAYINHSRVTYGEYSFCLDCSMAFGSPVFHKVGTSCGIPSARVYNIEIPASGQSIVGAGDEDEDEREYPGPGIADLILSIFIAAALVAAFIGAIYLAIC